MANLIVNGFNVGTELQTVILQIIGGPSIPVEQIGHLKELTARQNTTPLTATPVIYNGKRLHRNIYHDFSGELVFTRFAGDITNLMNGIVSNFQLTGRETYLSLYAQVFNTTLNSVDEYLFQQCVVNDHNFGQYSGTSEVDQSIAFRCQSLVITGAGSAVNVAAAGSSLANT